MHQIKNFEQIGSSVSNYSSFDALVQEAKKTKLEIEKPSKKSIQIDALELATMVQSKKFEVLELRIRNKKEIHNLEKRELYMEIDII